MHWFPTLPGKGQNSSEIYVAGGTDGIDCINFISIDKCIGRFYICSKTGRIEKVIDAHKGAILSLKWNYDGTALATCIISN